MQLQTNTTTIPKPLKRGDTVRYIGQNSWHGRVFEITARLTPERQAGLMLGYADQAYEVCVEARANGTCRVRRVMRGSTLERVA